MRKSINLFYSFIVSAFVASAAFVYPQMNVFAASTSDRSDKPSALFIAVLAALFAAALITSSVITYKIRTRNITKERSDSSDKEGSDT